MKRKFNSILFEIWYYLFNYYFIIIVYFVLIRRTLGTNQMVESLSKIDWPLALFMYVLFPVFSSLLPYMTNNKKRLRKRNRSTLLNIFIIMIFFLISLKLPFIEFVHANQSYICQTCFKSSDLTTIKPDERNRDSKFRWLSVSLLTFTLSDFTMKYWKE